MKKALLLVVAALLGGFSLGTLFGSGFSFASTAASSYAVSSPGYVLNARQVEEVQPAQAAPKAVEPVPLTERADMVLDALKEGDYTTLSTLVHPEKGVTLTPYSTVNTDCDRTLLPEQVAGLPEDTSAYLWGIEDGVGTPIELTGTEYFARYVFNADYTAAPHQGVDSILMQGNALENVSSAYPEGRFVEYHFPGLDASLEGYDWCSLKTVFELYQNQWYLVGLIHSEWTI